MIMLYVFQKNNELKICKPIYLYFSQQLQSNIMLLKNAEIFFPLFLAYPKENMKKIIVLHIYNLNRENKKRVSI